MTKGKPKVSLRKAPPLSAAAAEAFVQAQASEPATPSLPDVSTSGSLDVRVGRAIVARKTGDARRRMTIYLPPLLAKRLEMTGVEREQDMSEIITESLSAYLGGVSATMAQIDIEILKVQVLATLQALAPSHRKVIPLPILRAQFPGHDSKSMDACLLELERSGHLDLKIANDQTTVDRSHGINSDRGLLFFVLPVTH